VKHVYCDKEPIRPSRSAARRGKLGLSNKMTDKKECVAGHYCRLGVTLRSIINVDLLVFGIMMMKKSRHSKGDIIKPVSSDDWSLTVPGAESFNQ